MGIFQCGNAADGPDTPTPGKAANHIYSDSHLLVHLQEQQEGVYEGEIACYIADPLELDALLERVKAVDSIDWENHILRENDFQYEQIAGQLQNLQNLAVALISIASAVSVAILMLILMIRIRGRIPRSRNLSVYRQIQAGNCRQFILGGLDASIGRILFCFPDLAALLRTAQWPPVWRSGTWDRYGGIANRW